GRGGGRPAGRALLHVHRGRRLLRVDSRARISRPVHAGGRGRARARTLGGIGAGGHHSRVPHESARLLPQAPSDVGAASSLVRVASEGRLNHHARSAEVRTMTNALKALGVLALTVAAVLWFYGRSSAPAAPRPAVVSAPARPAPAPTPPPADPDADAPRTMPAVVPLPAITSDAPATGTNAPAPAVAPAAASAEPLETLVSRLLPAVVRIETAGAIGTGFFVKPDTILTNAHVVQANGTVTLRRADGTTSIARVVTTSPGLDLAILTVTGADATQSTIPLGSGRSARQGQEVLALGSPLGLQNTVTRGIVSAVRDVGGVTLVQTDAAINPGNSGGPLVDRAGVAIGITSLGVRSAVAQGLSFAIAIDHAADLLAGRRSDASATPLANLTQA